MNILPSLGNAILTLRVKGDEFKAGLGKAKTQAETTTKGIGKSFTNLQGKIQGAAGKVPVVGSSLAALASPAGLAAAGIGLVVGSLTKMVTKTLDVGRSLGTMREATGVSAENLQIYQRAIEETNGDAGKFDDVILRLSKSIGDANQGNKAAQDGFDALGLSWVDLAGKSPDEALKAVVGAANESLSATDGAAVKAALLGRSYTGLGGFANMTTAEITALTGSVAENAVTMSGDQVTAVDNFDAALRTLRDSVGGVTTGIGSALIPILTKVITFFNNDLLPPIKDIARVMGPVLMPILKAFYNIFGGNIKTVLVVVAGVLKGVAQVLTGDFSGAWETAKTIAQAVMNGIINVYNNTIGLIPGVSKIDMVSFADNIEIAEDAVKELGVASGETVEVVRETAVEIVEVAKQLTIDLKAENEQRLADALAQHKEDFEDRKAAFEARTQLRKEFLEREQEFHDAELEANKTAWGITDVEYRIAQASLETLSAEKYAALIEQAEAFGVDDLALLFAHNRNLAQEAQIGADAEKEIFRLAHEFIKANGAAAFAAYVANMEQNLAAGVVSAQEAAALIAEALGRAQDAAAGGGLAPGEGRDNNNPSGRTKQGSKAGLDDSEVEDMLAIGGVPFVDPYNGTIYLPGGGEIRPTSGGLSGDELAEYHVNYQAALAAVNAGTYNSPAPVGNGPSAEELREAQAAITERLGNTGIETRDTPGAQHGAFVRGSRMGSLVRVGENYTDENITPVGSRGGSGGGKQPLYMTLNFPQGAVENMLIGTVDDLYRQNRITVDLTG